MDNVLKSIDLLSSDYSLVKKEASSRQIKTRPESFASISGHFFNYLKTKIADTKELEKGSKYSNLAATLDKKLTVLSLDDLANNFVDDRAIKLRNRMYNNFINNVYNLYSELKSEKEESTDVNSARSIDLSSTDSDDFLKQQEKNMGLGSNVEPTPADLNSIDVIPSMPDAEEEQTNIENDTAAKFDMNVKEDAKNLDTESSINSVQSEDISSTSSNNFLEQQEKDMGISSTIEPKAVDLNIEPEVKHEPIISDGVKESEKSASDFSEIMRKEDTKASDSPIPEFKIITDKDISYDSSQKFNTSSKDVPKDYNELGENIRLDDILPVPERKETKSLEDVSKIETDDVKEFSFVPDNKENTGLSSNSETKAKDLKFDFSQATPTDINHIIDNKDTSKADLKALKNRIEVLRRQKADNDKTLAAAKEQAEKKSQEVDKRREDVASKKDLYLQQLNKLKELAMALDEDNKKAERDIQEFNSQATAYDEEAALLTKQADEYDSARSEIDNIIEFNNHDEENNGPLLKVA